MWKSMPLGDKSLRRYWQKLRVNATLCVNVKKLKANARRSNYLKGKINIKNRIYSIPYRANRPSTLEHMIEMV